MTLEFNKVVDQVLKMGSMIDKIDFDMTDRLQLAIDRFMAATDMDFIFDRIELVRSPDISGYRGAAPLDREIAEPINLIHAAPPAPQTATIIAADGSQVYPDEQAPVHYYLINVGVFVYHHGIDRLPEQITLPHLAFHKSEVHDTNKRLITNRTVDARRTVSEIKRLAEITWNYRKSTPHPILALYDNHLMFWANSDVTGSDQIMKDYHAALVQLNDSNATLAGYIDSPHRSRVMLRLLYLLSLKSEEEVRYKQRELAEGGDLEGLRDRHLFNALLEPGQRSAIMVQNSPKNLAYKRRGPSYEVAFFYLKVGDNENTNIARVDIPVWVARDKAVVDHLHALLLSQCRLQGRNPYPYAITRADELARVTGKDKLKLDEMINLELRKKGLDPRAISAKSRGKLLAHSDKREFELRSDLKETSL